MQKFQNYPHADFIEPLKAIRVSYPQHLGDVNCDSRETAEETQM